MKPFTDPIELLKEIEAWLSFNKEPDRVELANMKFDIMQFLANYKKPNEKYIQTLEDELFDFYKWEIFMNNPKEMWLDNDAIRSNVKYYLNQKTQFTKP